MIPTKFRFIWQSSFRVDLKKSFYQKQELPVSVMFVNGSRQNQQSLWRFYQGCFLPSFDSFAQAISEENIFQRSTNQKQEWPVVVMFVSGSGRNDQSSKRTCQMLPNKFRFICKEVSEQIFKNQPMRKKNCLCRPCLLTDRDKMSIIYRGPSINDSYQVSVHLAEGFQKIKM